MGSAGWALVVSSGESLSRPRLNAKQIIHNLLLLLQSQRGQVSTALVLVCVRVCVNIIDGICWETAV